MPQGPSGKRVVDVLDELVGIGVALVGMLGEGMRHDVVDRDRHPGDEAARWRRVFVGEPHQDLGECALSERPLSREGLIEDGAKREQITARIDPRLERLLGRHVAGAAEDIALARELRRVELGHTEVHDLGLALLQDHHVSRLDVAVDDAVLVRVGEGVGEASGDAQGVGPGHGAILDDVFEGAPAQELKRHEEGAGRGVDANLVHDDDAGMLEAGGRPRFLVEALLEGLAQFLGDRLEEEGLERDRAHQGKIAAFVHDTHGPPPDLADDFVAADGLGEGGLVHQFHWSDRLFRRPPSLAFSRILPPALKNVCDLSVFTLSSHRTSTLMFRSPGCTSSVSVIRPFRISIPGIFVVMRPPKGSSTTRTSST